MNELLPSPAVLLCNLRDPVRRVRILDWLDRSGVRAVEPAPTELHHSLGALLGLPGFVREPGPWLGRGFDEEVLVMFAFPRPLLHSFLAFFREDGLPPVALKAMITPTNVNWSLLLLRDALKEEHDRLQNTSRKEKQKS